ncbi:MAG TPA: hypothetical protein VGK27_00640 [Candidatus Deferrimicrobiaceae bacterium]|jgi:hypothetical protein
MAEFPDPGPVALFGSGETSRVGGNVFERLAARGGGHGPYRISILETPAGFEPNSDRVAGRIADFLRRRLENRRPEIEIIPARQRDTPFSPDDPALLAGLLRADLVFLGPGSPTYAVRQLRDSLAWHTLLARHRLGATTVFASAAMIAIGASALPVYEIYKVGEPVHWTEGLDLFGAYGLSLAFVPHWNNTDGGEELDTSHCYMGEKRFEALRALLPPDRTIVGVDESTALVAELSAGRGEVVGQGTVTILRGGREQRFAAGQSFDLGILGPFDKRSGRGAIPSAVWDAAVAATASPAVRPPVVVPDEVKTLVEARQTARERHDWGEADTLRKRIGALGWKITDTPEGQVIEARPAGASDE